MTHILSFLLYFPAIPPRFFLLHKSPSLKALRKIWIKCQVKKKLTAPLFPSPKKMYNISIMCSFNLLLQPFFPLLFIFLCFKLVHVKLLHYFLLNELKNWGRCVEDFKKSALNFVHRWIVGFEWKPGKRQEPYLIW